MSYNEVAKSLLEEGIAQREAWQLDVHDVAGAKIIDFGSRGGGTKAAGRALAGVCLGVVGAVELSGPRDEVGPWPTVTARPPNPLWNCLGCQYAGWPISVGSYFAMGSGPFRLLRGQEPVLAEYQLQEGSPVAVGVLEIAKLPPADVVESIAHQCHVSPDQLWLAVARTSSLPGRYQVVARSVETALHKLHELKFDLTTIRRGEGQAPLPPETTDDLQALGWTNDAVLYGGHVRLEVDGDDESIESVLPQIPSGASEVGGRPFLEIFESFDRDFYQIDPLLFSPARIEIANLRTGNTFQAGQLRPDLLAQSYGSA